MPTNNTTTPTSCADRRSLAKMAKLAKDIEELNEEVRADEKELEKGRAHLAALIRECYQRFGMEAVLRLADPSEIQTIPTASGHVVTVVDTINNNDNQRTSIRALLEEALKGASSTSE